MTKFCKDASSLRRVKKRMALEGWLIVGIPHPTGYRIEIVGADDSQPTTRGYGGK